MAKRKKAKKRRKGKSRTSPSSFRRTHYRGKDKAGRMRWLRKKTKRHRPKRLTESTRARFKKRVHQLLRKAKRPRANQAARAEIVRRVNDITYAVPAPRGHAMDGGEGYNGWLWISVPGAGKFIARVKGLVSSAFLDEAMRRVRAVYPDATGWINAD